MYTYPIRAVHHAGDSLAFLHFCGDFVADFFDDAAEIAAFNMTWN